MVHDLLSLALPEARHLAGAVLREELVQPTEPANLVGSAATRAAIFATASLSLLVALPGVSARRETVLITRADQGRDRSWRPDGSKHVDTFQALGVTLLAVLPGAVYTFALERWTGAFGVSFADRLIRFTAASAVFVAAFAGPAYALYRDHVLTGDVQSGRVSPLALEVVAIAYVAVPALCGSLVGWGKRRGYRWATLVLGESPEPRAWDYLWRHGRQGVVRAKTTSGAWLGGLYGTLPTGARSYAAGYPEAQDLYLAQQLSLDPETGEWRTDDEGRPVPVGTTGLLLRWDQIEFIEFLEVAG